MTAVCFQQPEVVLSQLYITDNELLYQTRIRKLICDAVAAILKNTYDVISPRRCPICMKFGPLTHNDMPMTTKWSESDPEAEIQYVGRLFLKTGGSFISAVY